MSLSLCSSWWYRDPIVIFALLLAGFFTSTTCAHAVRPSGHDRLIGEDLAPAKRITLLADEATRALRHAVWDDGVTPVISGLSALSATEVLRFLVEPIPPAPRSAWHTLRAGCTTTAPSDEMLDAARALLVREAVLASLDEEIEFPPAVLYSILEALPQPVQNPAASDRVASAVERLEKRERLTGVDRGDAMALCSALPDERAEALAWVTRLDALYATLLARADGAEGRAVVRIARAIRLMQAGWDFERDSLMDPPPERKSDASPSSAQRPLDRVMRDIRLARKESPSCDVLRRALRELRPTSVLLVSSVVIDAHDRLGVGRQIIALDAERLEAWCREAGLAPAGRAESPSSAGSASPTQQPAQQPAQRREGTRPKRLRDAPFGIKPLG